MANIRETLTLEDKFSATFTRFLQLGDKASGAAQRAANASQNYQSVLTRLDRQLITLNAQFAYATQEQNAMIAAGKQNSSAFSALDARMEKLGSTIRDLTRQYDAVEKEADQAAAATKRFDTQNRNLDVSSSGLTGTLRRVAGAFLGMQSVKWLVNTSDQITQTTARLQLMTGSAEAAAEANDQIFAAAMRSRGAYADMADLVAKLGTLAPDAFTDTGEIVAFAEQLQKQMALSGTSTQSAQAAMLQLTQGLSSGTLRGEELNSILEQTPMIAQTIADYLGMSTGEMRELASQGGLTAEVVKNAVLGAAEETNAAFEQMPMTWSQVWTSMQNIALRALNPILTGINWLANNIEIVGPIVLGVATAFGILAGAILLYNAQQTISNGLAAVGAARAALKTGATLAEAAATKTATGAQIGLNAALLASPITWVVAGVIALVAAFYAVVAAINKVTGSSLSATGIITGAIMVALAFVGNLFITTINTIMDVVAVFYNVFAAIANFLANVFVDPLGAAARLFFDFADIVLSVLQTLASAIDTIFGSHLGDAVQGWRDSLGGWVDDTFGKGIEVVPKIDSQDYHLDRFEYGKAWDAGYQWGENLNLFGGLGDMFGAEYDAKAYDELLGDTGNISDDVSSINKSVNMADEDLKSLVDMAERRYVNNINLQANTPVVTINGANTGNTEEDRRKLGDTIRDIILEQAAAGSYRSTARAYSGG